MLAKVKDKSLVKIDLLPTAKEVTEIYVDAGLPEERADFISRNYSLKLQMFHEFQKGKTISLYKEKQAEKLENGKR